MKSALFLIITTTLLLPLTLSLPTPLPNVAAKDIFPRPPLYVEHGGEVGAEALAERAVSGRDVAGRDVAETAAAATESGINFPAGNGDPAVGNKMDYSMDPLRHPASQLKKKMEMKMGRRASAAGQ